MSFKLLINDSVVEVKNLDMFQKGIILPDKTIVDIEILRDIDRKPIVDLTEDDLTKVEPRILIPFNNGVLLAKGILYFKDHDLYGIPETYENFIFFNKTESLTFKPKDLVEKEMKEILTFDSDFEYFNFIGLKMEKPLAEDIPITLPRTEGFSIKHISSYMPRDFKNNMQLPINNGAIMEINFTSFITKKVLNFTREAFLEAFNDYEILNNKYEDNLENKIITK